MDEKDTADVDFLDFAKDFDSANRCLLLSKLSAYGHQVSTGLSTGLQLSSRIEHSGFKSKVFCHSEWMLALVHRRDPCLDQYSYSSMLISYQK